jgi:hypothetical protein
MCSKMYALTRVWNGWNGEPCLQLAVKHASHKGAALGHLHSDVELLCVLEKAPLDKGVPRAGW